MGEQVHRLTDMEVEEVSLVDRPANKRPFLVVKRSESMGTELRPDGNGGFTRAAENTAKATELPKGVKDGIVAELDALQKKAADLFKAFKGAKEVEPKEDEPPVPFPEDLAGQVGELKECFTKLCEMLKMAGYQPGGEAEAPKPDGDAPPAGDGMPGATPAPPGASPTELRWREDKAIDAAVETMVAKVGAKMSKDRLNRFKQALSVLMGMFNELAGDEAGAPGGAAPPPAGAPSTTDPRGAADVAARAPMAMSEADAANLTKVLSTLTSKVDGLAAGQRAQDDRITTIGKSRGPGNASSVEGTKPTPVEKVSWPLDMNTPIDRESVNKQEFFG